MSLNLFSYKPVTDSDLRLYNEHKESIEKLIREKHQGIGDDFQLKPVSYLSRPMCGLDQTYRVALSNNQFVEVRFTAGGIVPPGADRPPVSFSVSDQLSSSAFDD